MFPIQEQPTWSIKDSSKLDDYQRCHRYYFFRHILGWNLDMPAHDLHFGESYHKAREYQLANSYADILNAYQAFLDCYRREFGPETDALYNPKTPTAVLNALLKFQSERSNDLIENEVVVLDGKKMLEISGTVPVDENRILHYRMDSIMRRVEDGMIFSWDHKTTSEKYIVGRQWADQFFLSIQNGTYTHCLYCMFPIETVLGIEFCGTGFAYLSRGSANRPAGYHATLRRVPAFKSPDQMNVWLWTVNQLLDDIDRDMDRLYHCTDNDEVLMAFSMNGTSCTDYRGCQYHDYCCCWSNPLRSCEKPPLGFIQEFWNPAEKELKVKKDLEWRR
jgi:hypothetical protein